MKKTFGVFLICAAALTWTGAAWSGGAGDARAIIAKAVKAAGGEEKLKKRESMTWSEKGTYYGMGDGQPYSSKLAIQYPDRFRMSVFVNGDMEVFTIVVNKDKGFVKTAGETKQMKKEELDNQLSSLKAGWISSLLPLKDAAFSLSVIDGVAVDKKPTNGVKVSRTDWPDVNLYFDKKSGLLLKAQFKTFSPEQKKQVTQETFFSNHKEMDGMRTPGRVVIHRDGKQFVEANMSDVKFGKIDDKIFAAP